MAVDMFLVIPKVKGETNDETYKKKDGIDILAWSWGMSQSGSFHTGGGGGAGKVAVQDISITKWVDSASANLMAKCSGGEHYDEAELIVRKAGGKKPLEYIKIKLEKVMVTSVSTGGSGGEDKLTENISLNFAKIHYEYSKQKEDGSGEAAMEYDFDASANKLG